MLRAGCPWRDLPCDGLNWRTVYGYFVRWRDNGIWERLLKGLARRAHSRIYFMDASYVKVNGSGANPAGGQQFQAMGASRGGTTTKIHAIVDGKGRVIRLLLSAGNVADVSMAPELIKGLEKTGCTVLTADKAYDSDYLRMLLIEHDIFPCFSLNSTRKEKRPFHRGYYRKRHLVENLFATLKRQRRVATRYDKLASSFLAFVTISAIIHWIS